MSGAPGGRTYYGNVNPELLGWMPLTAGRVLELGCGTGALAASYRERNPGLHYTGVELHGPSAETAATRVDRLLTGDFTAMTDLEVGQGAPFDLIVLGDVLEHLTDAEGVLRRLHGLLADDGHLVVSVPNVGHWSAFFHLMHGRWPAADSGLFDRTHVRFFTHPSLLDALAAGGFAQVKARPRNFPLDRAKAEEWIPKLADMAAACGIDRAGFVARANALQYVVVARKAEAPPPAPFRLHVAALAPRLMEVRARLPADHLQSVPELIVSYQEKALNLPAAALDQPKIMLVQRPAPPDPDQWLELLVKATAKGWLIVTEYDDHPDLVGNVLGWDNRRPTHWMIAQHVHAVQTSTPVLAEVFRRHAPEVAVFPNAAFARPPLRPAAEGPLTVFHGALNRGAFTADLARALAPAIAAHPDLRFEVVHDRAFFDALPTGNKRFQPVLSYPNYLDTLAGCDVALLPLEGRAEELTKSDLKWVEAAARSVAVIASPPVYRETVRDGENGLIAAGPDDFAAALARLAGDAALRGRLVRAAWEEVGDRRMFSGQVRARMAWYRSLWSRRADLHAGLMARAPALAAAMGGAPFPV